jgi:2-polyprenyl-6-methoxyphenol hydroxylase-like FAD-dependent oxidoreductase
VAGINKYRHSISFQNVASEYASSEIKFGWQVQAISQNEDQVTIEAINIKSGERKVYHAQYAVGCDGGKSLVRKSLGNKCMVFETYFQHEDHSKDHIYSVPQVSTSKVNLILQK